MINYNLKQINGKLHFQPNRRYGRKIFFCLLLVLIAFLLSLFPFFSHDIQRIIQSIGCMGILFALYDFLFKLKLTYVFDPVSRQVSRKVPGLYSQKLMSFEEAYLLLETYDCEPHYALSNKKDRYGKNYAISDFFSSGTKGRAEQEHYETEVLAAIEEIMTRQKASSQTLME